MSRRKIRSSLFFCVLGVVLVLMGALWAINMNRPVQLREILTRYLYIAGGFDVVKLGVFFFKGDLFDDTGPLERGRVRGRHTVVSWAAPVGEGAERGAGGG